MQSKDLEVGKIVFGPSLAQVSVSDRVWITLLAHTGKVGETRTGKQNLSRSLLACACKSIAGGVMVIAHGGDRRALRKCAAPTVEPPGKIQKASLKHLSLGYGEIVDYQDLRLH